MDWPALAIVFTVSSLMMILERFVNQQRQSNGRSASRCDAFDDTPAAVRRSSHFQTTRSRKKQTRPQTTTTFGGCCNFNDEQQQQQQDDDICSDDDDDYIRLHHHHPNQSAVTETQPPGGVTYRNSDQSIYCSGQNGNRRRANSSSSGSSQCGSPAESDTDPQPCEMQSSASAGQASGTGRRYCAEAVEIVTEFCDTAAAETDVEGEPIDEDCCEPRGSQCSSSWWRQCRRSMLTLSLLIDYVVRVLGVLFLIFLIISWFMRLVERKRKVPGDQDGYEETWRAWLKGHPFLDSIFSSVFGCETD